MKKLILATVAASALAAPAFAEECTMEMIQEKAAAMTPAMQALAANDPAKLQELTEMLAAQQAEIQASGDMTKMCALYDDMMAKIEE